MGGAGPPQLEEAAAAADDGLRRLVHWLGLPAARALRRAADAQGSAVSSALRYAFRALVAGAAGWELLRIIGALRPAAARTPALEEAMAAGDEMSRGRLPLGGDPGADGRDPAVAAAAAAGSARLQTPVMLKMFSGPEGNDMGAVEILAVAALSAASCIVKLRKAAVIGRLVASQGRVRGARASGWIRYAWQFFLLSLLSSVLAEAVSFMQSGIARKWRTNATHRLHDMYFPRMAYYRILADPQHVALLDADVRIACDVPNLANATAELIVMLTEAAVKIAVFGAAIAVRRSWVWTLAPPAFYLVAIHCILRTEPQHGISVISALRLFEARFRQHLSRLQEKSRTVCMLRGEAFELDLLQKSTKDICHLSKKRHDTMFFMDMTEWMFFRTPQAVSFIELAAFLCAAILGMRAPVVGAGAGSAPTPSEHLGTQFRDMHGFFNVCSGWSAVLSARTLIASSRYTAMQVTQLYERLEQLQSQARRSRRRRAKDRYAQIGGFSEDSYVDGGHGIIGFHSVQLRAPGQGVLLRDLTFRVHEGKSMLVVGPEGSGKTAIARCLCSLWPISTGQIIRPGGFTHVDEGALLRREVHYLPSMPCNAIGSLHDQLTYPSVVTGGLTDSDLRLRLRLAALEHLADEEGVYDVVDWSERLSLAEQQAFSFCRLLYHKPTFAILDGCTSALSRDMERRLVKAVQDCGITCVTLSRRPMLQDLHSHVLQLTGKVGDAQPGWDFRPLPCRRPPKEGKAVAPAPAMPPPQRRPRRDDTAEVHAAHAAGAVLSASPSSSSTSARNGTAGGSRHAPALGDESLHPADVVLQRWPGRVRRAAEILRLALHTPGRRRSALRKLLVMLAVAGGRSLAQWLFCRSLAGMARASMTGDRRSVVAELVASVGVVCLGGLADQVLKHQAGHLAADVWYGALAHLQRRVMREQTFGRVAASSVFGGSGLSEPLLRMAEFKGHVESVSAQLCEAMMHAGNMLLLLPALAGGLGVSALLPIAAHSFLVWACGALEPQACAGGPRIAQLEARFQLAHSRFRASAESSAFCGGGEAERDIIEDCFRELQWLASNIGPNEFLLKFAARLVSDLGHLPTLLQRLLSFRFAQRCLAAAPGVLTADTACAGLLLDRILQNPMVSAQSLVCCGALASRADVFCLDYLELLVACELVALRRQQSQPQQPAPPHHIAVTLDSPAAALGDVSSADSEALGGQHISVRGLDLSVVEGAMGQERSLATGVAFRVDERSPLLVTGPSLSGKSMLARALLGLVQAPGLGASVSVAGLVNARPPLELVMPVPQEPYLVTGGRLVAQLAYPAIVRWPVRPPYELSVEGPRKVMKERALLDHFRPLGAFAASVVDVPCGEGRARARVAFRGVTELVKALARPQDRCMDGHELECEVSDWPEANRHNQGAALCMGRMRRCLQHVGLQSLLLREADGWLAKRSWEEVLSREEQQRLCLARGLYHARAFLLLDDCTSTLFADDERRFYRSLSRDWGLTPIALSQRPIAADVFTREMRLGDASSPGRWQLTAGPALEADSAGTQ